MPVDASRSRVTILENGSLKLAPRLLAGKRPEAVACASSAFSSSKISANSHEFLLSALFKTLESEKRLFLSDIYNFFQLRGVSAGAQSCGCRPVFVNPLLEVTQIGDLPIFATLGARERRRNNADFPELAHGIETQVEQATKIREIYQLNRLRCLH